MTNTTVQPWTLKRTDETRQVEDVLRKSGFEDVAAYRYNSASIRVRVIDNRFKGLSQEKRDALVEPHLEKLPERTQGDILSLYTFTRSELAQTPETFREFYLNAEFEDPSPSLL